MKQHYAKLPSNVEAARGDWDPDQAPGVAGEKAFWSKFSKVAVQGNPVVTPNDDGTFSVTTALQLTDAESNKTEHQGAHARDLREGRQAADHGRGEGLTRAHPACSRLVPVLTGSASRCRSDRERCQALRGGR